MARTIPSHYTGCEVYRGYTISISQGRYHAHDEEGLLAAFPSTETRAEMRERIDWRLD